MRRCIRFTAPRPRDESPLEIVLYDNDTKRIQNRSQQSVKVDPVVSQVRVLLG